MLKQQSITYEQMLSDTVANLSEKEQALLKYPTRLIGPESVNEIKELLENAGFVRFEGGPVLMGTNDGLPCSIEGTRLNETPSREIGIPPFYISRFTVSNLEYEKFDRRHSRTYTSAGDKNPVTCITYGKAIGYALWLSEQTGLSFSLPTEPQYIAATAPYGWQYPYQQEGMPKRKAQNHYRAFPDMYPEGELGSTLEVDDPLVQPNHLGLYHPTGNVSIFSFGHYPTPGHWGSVSDGSYVVALGGNFRLCPFGTPNITRGILDVTGITDTVGLRLVHPDPEYLLSQRA